MIYFQVDDMTCGHCASLIRKAVVEVDEMAKVEVDLNNHLVRVDLITADEQEINDAIREAGYTPVIVQNAALLVSESTNKGCCSR